MNKSKESSSAGFIKPIPISNLIKCLTERRFTGSNNTSRMRRLTEVNIVEYIAQFSTSAPQWIDIDVSKPPKEQKTEELGSNLNKNMPITGELNHSKSSDNGKISQSHLTRVLGGKGAFNYNTIRYIGRLSGFVLNTRHRFTEEFVLAEYRIWQKESRIAQQERSNIGLRLHEAEASRSRLIVAQAQPFRKAVSSILYGAEKVVVIHASENYKDKESFLGRSALGKNIARFCAFEAPIDRRRTLLTASLAELETSDPDRVAGRISAKFGIARWVGNNVVDDICDLLRSVERPLLFLPGTRHIEDEVLTSFLSQLFSTIPSDTDLKVLIPTKQAIKVHAIVPQEGFTSIPTSSIPLDRLLADDMERCILWRANVGQDQYAELGLALNDISLELRVPSFANIIAGKHLAARLIDRPVSSPWQLLNKNITDQAYDSEKQILKEKDKKNISELNDESSFILFIDSLDQNVKNLLLRVTIFRGEFTFRSLEACAKGLELKGDELKIIVNDFCVFGALVRDKISDSNLFSLDPLWMKLLESVEGRDVQVSLAKTYYFEFIDKELQEAQSYYRENLHAIDLANVHSFLRLSSEGFSINSLMMEVWTKIQTTIDKNPDVNPFTIHIDVPEVEHYKTDKPKITSSPTHGLESNHEMVSRAIFLIKFCADLSLFWEASGLSFWRVGHLDYAIKFSKRMYDALIKGSEIELARQVLAIKIDLQLSYLDIEANQYRNNLSYIKINSLENQIEQDLKRSAYKYGKARFQLLRGIRENRVNKLKGLDRIEDAILQTAAIAGRNPSDLSRDNFPDLLMDLDRINIAKCLNVAAVQELAKANLRSGQIKKSLQIGRSLLNVAKYTFESHMFIEAALTQLHALWYDYCLSTDEPISQKNLAAFKNQIFHLSPTLSHEKPDVMPYASHYMAINGLYNIERALSDLRNGNNDWLHERHSHGEYLFFSGINQLNDNSWRASYFLMLADTYLRYSISENTPIHICSENPTTITANTDVEIGSVYLSLAYLMRFINIASNMGLASFPFLECPLPECIILDRMSGKLSELLQADISNIIKDAAHLFLAMNGKNSGDNDMLIFFQTNAEYVKDYEQYADV